MMFKIGDEIRFKAIYAPGGASHRAGRGWSPGSGPHVPAGAAGVVTYATSKRLSGTRRDVQEHVVTVKLTKRLPWLDDQGNEVEFLWYEDPQETEGDAAPKFIEAAKVEKKAVKRQRKVAVPIEVTLPIHRFPVIKAWSFGDKKGGYEVPHFEYPEAKRVAVLLGKQGTFTLIDNVSSRDIVIYTYRDYGVPPDDAYPPGEPDWGVWEEEWIVTKGNGNGTGEKKTWAIGAGELHWKKVTW